MRKKFNRYPVLLLALLGASALFISLTAAAPFALPPGPGDVEPLPEINPFARPPHAMQVAAPRLLSATAPITLPDPAWRIGITGDGLYRLTYAALEAAGVPTGTAPSAYHLSWRGQDVALEELGDALLFYAEKFHGSTQDEKYTSENVVWLTVDATTPGLRMTTRDVTPGGGAPLAWITATARTEENLKYWARWSDTPGTDTTWFWERINTLTTVTRTYPLALTMPVTQGYTATLVMEVASYNYNNSVNPDHHLRVAINGAVAGETFWDGKTGYIFTVTVPAVALQDGGNDLQVAYLTDVGHQTVYFDWAMLTYRRQPVASDGALAWDAPLSGALAVTLTGLTAEARPYDVSDPLRPIALTGYATATAGSALTFIWRDTVTLDTAYRVEAPCPVTPTLTHPPTDLLSPTIGADEIIVAPRAFFDALKPLADRRRTQGLRVKVVAVEDVYDLFNGGVVHPEAIRAFVAYAHAHWPAPAPRYLLLAGDGHFNPKGYNPAAYGEFVPVWIPPYLEFADPDQGEVPVDSRFGDVDGDGAPELAVGRLPVNSTEELAGVVQKLLNYEDAPLAPRMGRALFVADDGSTYPEGFADMLDRLQAGFASPAVTAQTVYIQDYCPKTASSTPAEWYADCPSATLALTQTWSAGAALLTYAGHGAVHRWAHEPLLVNAQLPSLRPTDGMPFLISLDCWDGYWMFPSRYGGDRDVRSIGEWATTALTDSGAIATFGPAGLGYLYIEESLAQAMFDALLNHGARSLGELTQAGRQAISGSYLARTYTLLGDPALQLSWSSLMVEPPSTVLTVGESLDLHATFAATITLRNQPDFSVTPDWTAITGTLSQAGIFTAPHKAMTTYLIAHYGTISSPVTVTVVAGTLTTITVSPDPLIIGVRETTSMTALVTDRWENPLDTTALAWSTNVGTIDVTTGVFTAPIHASAGWITATMSGVTGHAYVSVQIPEVAQVNVIPNDLYLAVNQTTVFSATALDQWGVSIPMTATWSAETGQIDSCGVYTAPSYPVQDVITATASNGTSGTAQVLVDARVYLPLVLRR